MATITPREPAEKVENNKDSVTLSKELIVSEQAVLGAILNASKKQEVSVLNEIIETVKEVDFSQSEHKTIFSACCFLLGSGYKPDPATLTHHISTSKDIEIMDVEYIYAIEHQSRNEIAENYKYHLTNIRKHGSLKELRSVSKEIESISQRKNVDSVDSVLEEASELIKGIKRDDANTPKLVSSSLGDFIDDLDARFNGLKTGINTNYEDLDEVLGGLEPGNLVVVGGRPSMGKTTFCMNLSAKFSILRSQETQMPTHFFSLEMGEDQLIRNYTGMLGNIELSRLKKGNLEQGDWANLNKAIGQLDSAPIIIDDMPGISPAKIRRRTEQSIEEFGTKIVVIDYLQLVSPDRFSGTREQDIADISRKLKLMAKELGIIVILLAQLSRDLERRPDKRPVMSDLRESGAIEQDADVIIFIYRDEVYNPDTEYKDTAEILVRKNRSGETGDVRMLTVLKYGQFKNYSVMENLSY